MRPGFEMRHLCLVACLLLTTAAVADAADYFVATDGGHFVSCSGAQNIATPTYSINDALRCLSPGDTLHLRGGVYDQSIRDIPSGTSWANPVRVKAYRPDASSGPESVWLRPSSWSDYVLYLAQYEQYIEFDGINMDSSYTQHGTIKIEGWSGGNAHHIRVMNAELFRQTDGVADHHTSQIMLTNSAPGIVGGNEFINLKVHGGGDQGETSYGFYVQSAGNLIDGCDIYDVSAAGIHIYNGYGYAADGNTVRNSTIRDISRSGDGRGWGVIVGSGSGNRVYNNLIYNIALPGWGNGGVSVLAGFDTQIYNNTIYGSLATGIWIAGGSQTQVLNNILYGNCCGNYLNYVADTLESHNLTEDPGFVDAANRDFRLQSGSRAIDMGVSLVSADIVGVARPQGSAHDVGAYEFLSGTSGGGSGGGPPAAVPSPDGTRAPSVPVIVDTALGRWTIGSGMEIVRDGVHIGWGYGSQILWYRNVIYVLGTDNNWWQWNGDFWAYVGATDPASSGGSAPGGSLEVSPDGTTSPSAPYIVDSSRAVWTIGPSQEILRNDVHAGGGYGSQIVWWGGVIYVVGTDGNLWRWTGDFWTNQ